MARAATRDVTGHILSQSKLHRNIPTLTKRKNLEKKRGTMCDQASSPDAVQVWDDFETFTGTLF